VADGTVVLSGDARAHVERCLRCQAELVQYRRALRALRALRDDVLEPAPGLVPDVLAALQQAGERQAVRSLLDRRRVAYAGGLAAAAVATAGAVVLATRSRRASRPGVPVTDIAPAVRGV
jgi:hypothetical protein